MDYQAEPQEETGLPHPVEGYYEFNDTSRYERYRHTVAIRQVFFRGIVTEVLTLFAVVLLLFYDSNSNTTILLLSITLAWNAYVVYWMVKHDSSQRSIALHVKQSLRELSFAASLEMANAESRDLKFLCGNCCSKIHPVFQDALPDSDIGVAVRILQPEKGYVTYARAGELSDGRESYTDPVRISGPLYRVLTCKRGRDSRVITCNDVDRAHKDCMLEEDRNSEHQDYSAHVKSMMASCLTYKNQDGSVDLVGILYVTSNKKNAFHDEVIDLMDIAAGYVNEVLREKIDTISWELTD